MVWFVFNLLELYWVWFGRLFNRPCFMFDRFLLVFFVIQNQSTVLGFACLGFQTDELKKGLTYMKFEVKLYNYKCYASAHKIHSLVVFRNGNFLSWSFCIIKFISVLYRDCIESNHKDFPLKL